MVHLPTRVLLATDGSEDASVVTQGAMDIAKRSGSGLRVMYSFEFIPPREYMSVALRLRSTDDFSRQGQLLLDEQVKEIEASGVPVAGVWAA